MAASVASVEAEVALVVVLEASPVAFCPLLPSFSSLPFSPHRVSEASGKACKRFYQP